MIILLYHHGVLTFIILLLLTLAAADNEVCNEDYEGTQNNNFYALSKTQTDDVDYPLLNALFPNLSRLQTAWETHPLLSRVSFTQQEQDTQPLDNKQIIPTIQHNRQLISQLKLINNQHQDEDPILSLLSVDDTALILTQPDMNHGNEYKLLKKIIIQDGPEKGEEYNGMLPGTHYSLQDILQHFHYGGFSVVINKLLWRSIANFARQLEQELGAVEVNVNLYMTPDVVSEKDRTNEDKINGNVREGFEAHWDWMDVIIVQLSGMKRWSVARESSIYLSSKDQKRKPTLEELKHVQRYDDFTLCPGDILYIPRGSIHNASTIDFDHLQENNNEGRIDLDSCPPYPNEALDRRVGPSLHLTFGLLESNDATIETLLHYALDAYYESSNNSMNEIAVSKSTCSRSNFYGVAVDHDIRWSSVLHHVIAEVARREHICDHILQTNRRPSSIDVNCNEGTTILRKSVPLMLDDINESSQQYLNLQQTYISGLDVLVSSANLAKTATLIQTHLLKPPPDDDALIFHYPSYSEQDVIICPEALNELSEDDFIHKLNTFDKFSRESFDIAFASLNNWGKQRRQDDRQQQCIKLDKVGQ